MAEKNKKIGRNAPAGLDKNKKSAIIGRMKWLLHGFCADHSLWAIGSVG